MMDIDEAPQENKEELLKQAKILFRSAAWVSVMDDKGGVESLSVERNAIINNLRRFATEPDYLSLVPVFNVILTSHKAWDEWSRSFSEFSHELRAVKDSLPLLLRQCMYDLSYCVATRYRERNWLNAFFASIVVSFRQFIKPNPNFPDLPVYLNISAVEKSALNELAEILGMPQRILD